MLPEQQQRIMGYFIEEAKDHLNTIEQGLLNLQATIEDPELVNEVFRAAHSVKGGAAMLGLTSIQQTSHRLEDSFKVLKECSVKVDQQLESLFLRIFDTLQGLLEQLSGPFGLTEELGEQMVRELEPVFEELNQHLGGLVGQRGSDADESSPLPIPQQVQALMGVGAFSSDRSFADSGSVYAQLDATPTEESALHLVFDSDVPARMREMLQEFKQPEGPESRRQLKSICRNLKMAGEEFELPDWIELIEAVEKAIANPENTYRALAPTVIKDIKQAQEQVLSGESESIAPSAKLLALLRAVVVPETDFEDLLAFAQPSSFGKNVVSVEDAAWDLALGSDSRAGEQLLPSISSLSMEELFDQLDGGESDDDSGGRGVQLSRRESAQFDDSPGFGDSDLDTSAFRISTRTGPEVGAAELNTLADLFDGESPDLDGAWEEEEDLDYANSSRMPAGGMQALEDDNSGDFTDLLFDEYSVENSETNAAPPIDDLTSLFGEDLVWSEPDGSAVAVGQENAGLRQPPTRKQLETINSRAGLEGGDGTDSRTRRQAEEDALATLLDEVAAQTSAVGAEDGDLDDLFGDLGESEAAGVPRLSNEYSLNPDAFDGEFSESAAGGGGNDSGAGEMDDFELLSELGEDSDLSELLSISSGFLSSRQGEGGSIGPDRPTSNARSKQNEEIDSIFNMTSNSDLDISAEGNWLDDAFGQEDESVQPANLELEDTDLDALFGEITSGPISEEEETVGALPSASTSREAADLAALFGSVPTGTEYEEEASGQVRGSFLNLGGDSELPSAGMESDEGDLASLFSGSEATVSEEGLADLAAVELADLDDRPDGEISSFESDGGTFDLLEDMFGEEPQPPVDAEAALDLQELSPQLPDGEFDSEGADLFDRPNPEAAVESEDEDDLFEALETDFSSGDLEVLSLESFDGMFEGDADLLAALETGATLNNTEELDAFDDLLDSSDAGPLVTTGFWDTEERSSPDESSELEDESLADFFSDVKSGGEDAEGNFDDLEALLIAGGAGAAALASGGTNQNPVNTEVFSDLEDLLSESATMPEIQGRTATTARKAPPAAASESEDEFGDLEKLLEDPKDSGRSQGEANIGQSAVNRPRRNPRAGGFGDQTMRVPVKQLDNLSNLMGELVVNRNSLEQDQERMRQFLDNLLHQVTLLSDVSQRTQDFYERSLLEIALLANRQGHRSAWRSEESSHSRESAWRPEEMDRFTPFHSLAQEIIELIVRVRESAADIEFLVDEADQVTRQLRQVTTQLQEGLTRARMKPFAETTDRLFRAVREIGIKCGKQAQLQVEGKDILIDKMIVDQLYDPMTHLVNNAITHGIEAPEVRLAAGKPAMGRITIRAFHQGNQTVVSVSDDGAGIDPQKVKAKAIKQNLLTAAQAQRMSRSEVYNLLFMAGFSTQEEATEYAGRGVGMNVVETSLHEIRGTVSIDSTLGKGTVFTIRLPLVLSISKALTCISDRSRIAFPMDGVEDMIDVPRDQVTTGADGLPCIEWRGSILPFRPLRDLLPYHRHLGRGGVYGFNTDDDMISVIVLRSAGNFLAVQVDQVSTEQEIVIKQLEGPVPKPIGIAGATVLGDGRIVAIADVLELIDLATGRLRTEAGGTLWDESARAAAEAEVEKTEPTVLIVDDSITVRSLLSITFEKAGYRVEEARDGKEAWEKMKSGLPCDIVFCDIEMPRMDGLELLSRMQKDTVLCELPIAMLTSRGADRHRQMAYGLGAKGYFTKPYLEEQLMDAAARMLKGEVVGAPAVV